MQLLPLLVMRLPLVLRVMLGSCSGSALAAEAEVRSAEEESARRANGMEQCAHGEMLLRREFTGRRWRKVAKLQWLRAPARKCRVRVLWSAGRRRMAINANCHESERSIYKHDEK